VLSVTELPVLFRGMALQRKRAAKGMPVPAAEQTVVRFKGKVRFPPIADVRRVRFSAIWWSLPRCESNGQKADAPKVRFGGKADMVKPAAKHRGDHSPASVEHD